MPPRQQQTGVVLLGSGKVRDYGQVLSLVETKQKYPSVSPKHIPKFSFLKQF